MSGKQQSAVVDNLPNQEEEPIPTSDSEMEPAVQNNTELTGGRPIPFPQEQAVQPIGAPERKEVELTQKPPRPDEKMTGTTSQPTDSAPQNDETLKSAMNAVSTTDQSSPHSPAVDSSRSRLDQITKNLAALTFADQSSSTNHVAEPSNQVAHKTEAETLPEKNQPSGQPEKEEVMEVSSGPNAVVMEEVENGEGDEPSSPNTKNSTMTFTFGEGTSENSVSLFLRCFYLYYL